MIIYFYTLFCVYILVRYYLILFMVQQLHTEKYLTIQEICGNLSQITKSEAESKGLEPCKKCY